MEQIYVCSSDLSDAYNASCKIITIITIKVIQMSYIWKYYNNKIFEFVIDLMLLRYPVKPVRCVNVYLNHEDVIMFIPH